MLTSLPCATNDCYPGTLGMRPAFIGMSGNDTMGDILEERLRQDSVEPKLVRKDEVRTNIGFNMTSTDGGHIMCVAGTANAALSPDDVLPVLRETAAQAKTVYFGGSFKPKSFSHAFSSIVEIARKNDAAAKISGSAIPGL